MDINFGHGFWIGSVNPGVQNKSRSGSDPSKPDSDPIL